MLIFTLFFTIFLLIQFRNMWIYNLRMKMISNDIDQFLKMPSYNSMICQFWIWSARGFGWKD